MKSHGKRPPRKVNRATEAKKLPCATDELPATRGNVRRAIDYGKNAHHSTYILTSKYLQYKIQVSKKT